MLTKESMADRVSDTIADGNGDVVFAGFSSAAISAMLQFGASKVELQKMYKNLLNHNLRHLNKTV